MSDSGLDSLPFPYRINHARRYSFLDSRTSTSVEVASTRQKVALSVRTLARTATRTLVRLESRLAHEYAQTALRLLLDCLGTILITHLDRTPRERVHYRSQRTRPHVLLMSVSRLHSSRGKAVVAWVGCRRRFWSSKSNILQGRGRDESKSSRKTNM